MTRVIGLANWLGLFLMLFFNIFFFNFILQYLVDRGLRFVNCFDLLSIELFWYYNPSRRFDKLTRVAF
jgi:hypothetical protein